MGYKVYIKDKSSKGRFEKWNNTDYKNKSSAKQEVKKALKRFDKQSLGKPTFEIRKSELKEKVKKAIGSSDWVRQQTQI